MRQRLSRGAAAGPGRALHVLALPALLALSATPHPLPAAAPAQQIASAGFDRLAESSGLKATGSFPFDYQHLVFAAPSAETVDVWAAVSVHAGRVRPVFQGGWKYALALRFELFRGDTLVASDSSLIQHVLSSPIPEETSDGFPIQARLRVPPGAYRYRLQVTDLNWTSPPSVNDKTGELWVPAFDRSRPVVSSIAIAADSGGTWLPADEVALKLNAARIVRKDSRPFVYYEVYGLTPGGAFRGEVRLVSTWASTGQGETFTGSRRPFQLQYRGTAPSDPREPVRSSLRLDLSKTEPGPYAVTVTITDLATGRVSETRRAELKVRTDPVRGPPLRIREIGPRGNDGG